MSICRPVYLSLSLWVCMYAWVYASLGTLSLKLSTKMPIRSKIDKLCLIFYCHRFGLVCTRAFAYRKSRIASSLCGLAPHILQLFALIGKCEISCLSIRPFRFHVCVKCLFAFWNSLCLFSGRTVSRCDADFFLSFFVVCFAADCAQFYWCCSFISLVNMPHSYQLRGLSANSL